MEAKALHDFKASSPDELSFDKGSIVKVRYNVCTQALGSMDCNSFSFFPSSFWKNGFSWLFPFPRCHSFWFGGGLPASNVIGNTRHRLHPPSIWRASMLGYTSLCDLRRAECARGGGGGEGKKQKKRGVISAIPASTQTQATAYPAQCTPQYALI